MTDRGRHAKKIDYTHWTGGTASAFAMAAGVIGSTLASAAHLSETLLRMRGNLLAYVDGVQAPGGLTRVAVGIILVPEGTGASVLWSPLTDGDAPWIWIDCFALGYEEGVVDAVGFQGLSVYRSVIDNRAMRIVRNQEVQVVFESVTALSAIAINAVLDVRVLAGT